MTLWLLALGLWVVSMALVVGVTAVYQWRLKRRPHPGSYVSHTWRHDQIRDRRDE